MGQILAIVSSKGGVGKTTTAVNLAAAFASLSFPALLVEADPQCGLVASFGYDRFDIPRGLSQIVRGEVRIEDATFETPVKALHLVSSNVWTQDEEALYLDAFERDPLALRRATAPLRAAYDYIVIDAPPMLGPITVAVLAAADRFIVPVPTEPHAVRALGRLLEAAELVRSRYNPELHFDGIALTMVDGRTRLAQSLADDLRSRYVDQVYQSIIPRSVRLAEIPTSGKPLAVAAPASRGGRAYAALAEEVLLQHARERALARAGDQPEEADESGPVEDVLAAAAEDAEVGDHPGTASGGVTDLASLEQPVEEEWDERFVDLETYLEMESGSPSRTAVADDDGWDESWDEWGEKNR